VTSAIKGRRGQQFLRDTLEALEDMPQKRLVTGALEREGEYCTLGVVAAKRGQLEALKRFDTDDGGYFDTKAVSEHLHIAQALAKEIMFENDEGGWGDTPEIRWMRMRQWVAEQIQ